MFENYIDWTISNQAPNRRRLIDYPIWSRIFNIFEAREILNFSLCLQRKYNKYLELRYSQSINEN